MLAIWHPFWYECDLPIDVGQTGKFEFFESPPPYVTSDGLPVFWHHGWRTEPNQRRYILNLRILGIRHPELGQIQSIDTKGLDYTVTMKDGRVAKLEAEEHPGTIYFLKNNEPGNYETPWTLNDWRFYVEVEEL